MDKQEKMELHEELVQTLPDGYFLGEKKEQKFELKGKHKAIKVSKHKRNKKKGW